MLEKPVRSPLLRSKALPARARLMSSRWAVAVALGLVALIALWWSGAFIAEAQEDGTTPFRELAGPYQIEVLVVESTLSLGAVLIFITVTEASTGQPVPDARVVLRTFHESTSKEGAATAHNTPQFPERYDVQLNLSSPGKWQITVEVSSALGAVGVELPAVEVPVMRQFSSGTIVFAVVFGLIIVTAIYLYWRYQRKRQRRQPPRWPEQGSDTDSHPGSGPIGQ